MTELALDELSAELRMLGTQAQYPHSCQQIPDHSKAGDVNNLNYSLAHKEKPELEIR